MRPLFPVLALIALLPAAATAQTRAECEYRNPDHPTWDFVRSCTVTTETAAGRTTTVARMTNGSDITLVEDGTPEAPRFTINDHPSRPDAQAGPGCFLTLEDQETICIRGAGVETAAAAPAEAAATDTAPDATDTAPDATQGGDPAFGGGVAGHCLAWVSQADREGLIAKGACTRRTDCAEIEGEAGMSCLIDFVWKTGRQTVITRRNDVYTLDGAVARPRQDGCLTDDGAGLNFCFSEAAMTEAAYPAIALAPAPDPAVAAAAAPLSAADAPAEPGAAPTTEAAAAPVANRCSFLRDGVEVSSWTCTEAVACEAPVCTVTYVFENGTTVTLDTADGQVMLMNGAKADRAAWAEGAVVDVTRPGAPYTFRFTPGAVTAAE